MSTSILYHGFGIQEHRYLRTEYMGEALIFHLEKSPDRQQCAICGQQIRQIRTVPIGSKPVFLRPSPPSAAVPVLWRIATRADGS